ncbi:hypothetical protein AAFF_G00102870 [Aldrovandia affinis]|uniref:Uncharacterized protein n=1 Tax=Aldrovandia affinis TaxID=143900 RepID=A0AAD7RUJ0_9TELE|nr:hypothetical protein AAFF_G00102870 [Aldrovandia affinis]
MLTVARHLRVAHQVANAKERDILTKLATGHINLRKCRCPVPGCHFHGQKLDRHLVAIHTELSEKRRQAYSVRAKKEEAIDQLGKLRASDPAIPMVSQLDVQASEGGSPVPSHQEESEEEEGHCNNPACKRQKQALEKKNSNLETELNRLRKRYRHHFRQSLVKAVLPQVTLAEKDAAEVQGEAGPSTFGKKRTRATRRAEEEADEAGGPQQEAATEIEEEAGPSTIEKKRRRAEEEEEEEKEDEPGSAWRKLSFGGSGRGSSFRFITFPDSIENCLDEYRKFQEGVEPTDKQRENVVSKFSRIKAFLEYMSTGQTDLWTWNFLCQPQRILEWARHVQEGGIQVTTARFYMINIRNFVEYMKETPPEHCRLNMPKWTAVSRAIRQALLTMGRKVVLRQLAVKASKVSKVVTKDTLNKCQELSKFKMPELLEDIEAAPLDDLAVRARFFGYLAAFLQSLYGHRSGVLTNMTVSEVLQAEGDETVGYVINVNQHKTNRQFGAAQIYLEPTEYRWMRTWVDLRKARGPQNNLFFTMTGKGPAKSLLKFFQAAWAEMGLPGRPTFTDIRTAVSTHNHQINDEEVKKLVADYMCHDLKTQNRFYALHHGVQEAKKLRQVFVAISAREMQESDAPSDPAASGQAPSTSASDAPPPLADAPSDPAASGQAPSTSAPDAPSTPTTGRYKRCIVSCSPVKVAMEAANKVKRKIGISPKIKRSGVKKH